PMNQRQSLSSSQSSRRRKTPRSASEAVGHSRSSQRSSSWSSSRMPRRQRQRTRRSSAWPAGSFIAPPMCSPRATPPQPRTPRATPPAARFAALRAAAASAMPRQHELLDLADRLGGIQALRAGPGAVHDGVAAVELERILEFVQPRAGVLVAAVHDPAMGLEQDRRPQVTLAVPPVARAGGAAAGAQDALVQAVELVAVGRRLQPLAVRRRRALGPQPGADRGVLG